MAYARKIVLHCPDGYQKALAGEEYAGEVQLVRL